MTRSPLRNGERVGHNRGDSGDLEHGQISEKTNTPFVKEETWKRTEGKGKRKVVWSLI